MEERDWDEEKDEAGENEGGASGEEGGVSRLTSEAGGGAGPLLRCRILLLGLSAIMQVEACTRSQSSSSANSDTASGFSSSSLEER